MPPTGACAAARQLSHRGPPPTPTAQAVGAAEALRTSAAVLLPRSAAYFAQQPRAEQATAMLFSRGGSAASRTSPSSILSSMTDLLDCNPSCHPPPLRRRWPRSNGRRTRLCDGLRRNKRLRRHPCHPDHAPARGWGAADVPSSKPAHRSSHQTRPTPAAAGSGLVKFSLLVPATFARSLC